MTVNDVTALILHCVSRGVYAGAFECVFYDGWNAVGDSLVFPIVVDDKTTGKVPSGNKSLNESPGSPFNSGAFIAT